MFSQSKYDYLPEANVYKSIFPASGQAVVLTKHLLGDFYCVFGMVHAILQS
jgi:hypothetical protein